MARIQQRRQLPQWQHRRSAVRHRVRERPALFRVRRAARPPRVGRRPAPLARGRLRVHPRGRRIPLCRGCRLSRGGRGALLAQYDAVARRHAPAAPRAARGLHDASLAAPRRPDLGTRPAGTAHDHRGRHDRELALRSSRQPALGGQAGDEPARPLGTLSPDRRSARAEGRGWPDGIPGRPDL